MSTENRFACFVFGLGLLCLAGCADDNGAVPVQGTVTLDGGTMPAEGSVQFLPIGAAEGYSMRPVEGRFESDGSYQV